MLLLHTEWGTYNLTNALRIDVYESKAKLTWDVFIGIDGHRHVLYNFESQKDAVVFGADIKKQILSALADSQKHGFGELFMEDICSDVMGRMTGS